MRAAVRSLKRKSMGTLCKGKVRYGNINKKMMRALTDAAPASGFRDPHHAGCRRMRAAKSYCFVSNDVSCLRTGVWRLAARNRARFAGIAILEARVRSKRSRIEVHRGDEAAY